MIAGSDRATAPCTPVRRPRQCCPFACSSPGALRQSRRALPPIATRRPCCEHCGCAMDTRSDFAETDLHILTFDIPDDVLERAAGAELAFTWVHCTSPLAWECPALTIEAWHAR